MNDHGTSRVSEFAAELQRSAYLYAGQKPPTTIDPDKYQEVAEQVYRQRYPSFVDPEHRREWLDSLVAPYRKAYNQRITDLEDLTRLRDIATAIDALQDVVNSKRSSIRWPPVATLPAGRMNAMTVRVRDSSDCLILIESELVEFFTRLCSLCGMALKFHQGQDDRAGHWGFSFDESHISDLVAARPEIGRAFSDLLISYLVEQKPPAGPAMESEHYQGRGISKVLCAAVMTFVLGHEFAHVHLGHMQNGLAFDRPHRILPATEIGYSWNIEYQADFWGARVAIEAGDRHLAGTATSFAGAELFLEAVAVVDRARTLISGSGRFQNDSGSHPPPTQRRDFLRAALGHILPDDHARSALLFGNAMRFLVNCLWEAAEPAIVAARVSGAELAPQWR